jgi:hypothetical protein
MRSPRMSLRYIRVTIRSCVSIIPLVLANAGTQSLALNSQH